MTTHRKLLILDLDETLVYAAAAPLPHPPDHIVNGFNVYRRPHLDSFLEYALDRFDVAVWSQGSGAYVRAVVDQLLPDTGCLKFIWGNERCTFVTNPAMRQYYWVKDLRKVRRRGYRLEHVIFVDDTSRKLERSYGNLVRIYSFRGKADDNELLHLKDYLEILASEPNVRQVDKRDWRDRILGNDTDAW